MTNNNDKQKEDIRKILVDIKFLLLFIVLRLLIADIYKMVTHVLELLIKAGY